ncbi:MAG: AAA family ATPase [Candidatus Marinimicrobia bacterium]|nr:AAA family ATPase [Candidatus Neomarinimicrobiota bacterium]|tara:strand:- start:4556 stop:6655 length:2100 start_codon:yes stop_codon:yes gene_type:complete
MNQQPIQNPESGIDPLEEYGLNLTALAKAGKIDPVIGREDEIRRIIQILSRRKKNNPVLIGEPGTGKTTVVEGLAKRIIEGDVPENIKGKQLIAMDLPAMVAGAMFKGQFEERLKNFIKAVKEKNGDIIVFIDEIHMIVGAGGQGQMDVANIIKPELAHGTLKVIGATTLNEYQKYVEPDAALERRFQQVYIQEPSVEDTITILRGIKDKYEVHHRLGIRDSALISAATLSERYISDRFLPDKAVDLVDEAASKLRMEMNSAPELIDDLNRKLIQLEVEREALKKEKDPKSKERLSDCKKEIDKTRKNLDQYTNIWENEKQAVSRISRLKEELEDVKFKMENHFRDGNYAAASKIQYDTIPDLEEKIESLIQTLENSQFVKLDVRTNDIAEVVSKWTGIPVQKMLEGEKEKLLNLESVFRNRVIGQEEALKKTADVIRMSKLGVSDKEKPLGSFLFMGKTGVGKTELAKTIAEALFDDEKALIRIDMSELMEQHSISKLIGSPPGYVGYDEGGYLTEKIRRRPYSVILFDEIEKAHPAILNILLQVLDDGRLTDSKGRAVNFKNTIIVMTTNLSRQEVNTFLKPELRNRIDDIIHFNDLNKDAIEKIVDIHIKRMIDTLAQQGLTCTVDDSIREYLVKYGYEPEFGARPIKRLIQRGILSELSKFMLETPEIHEINLDFDQGIIIQQNNIEQSNSAAAA